MVKVVPILGVLFAEMVPLKASSIIFFVIESPIPVPFSILLVVKNGLKILLRVVGAMPLALSVMVMEISDGFF